MTISVKAFSELTPQELYDILQLRAAIFVVEQACVYQDLDGKDAEALHVQGTVKGQLVAYTRVLAPGAGFEDASIGRVAVHQDARGKGYGREIMAVSLAAVSQYFKTSQITLSAQSYLIKFYREMGFEEKGKEYLEDGIPHIRMVRH